MKSRSIEVLFLCTFACFFINEVHALRTRILGGRDPESNEVKYLVAVQSVTALCGGGIIDDKFIVTAAHCVKINQKTGTLAQPTRIYAGVHNTRSFDPQSTIIIDVVTAFLPKSIKLPFGDVAVLELKESLNLEKNKEKLQKLELPESISDGETVNYPSYDDLEFKFAGFGHSHLEERKDASGKIFLATATSGPMQVAKAKIVDSKTCRKKFYGFLGDSQMCVSIIEDKKLVHHQGVCTGDSGSPVVLDNKTIVGVASFTTDALCNTNARPAIFTRVSSHNEFIKNAIKGDTSNMIIIPK